MKRIISVFTCFVLILGVLSFGAGADSSGLDGGSYVSRGGCGGMNGYAGSIGGAGGYGIAMQNQNSSGLDGVCAYIRGGVTEPEFSSIGGEWAVLALLRSGAEEADSDYIKGYISRVGDYVRENENDGILDKDLSTDNSRLIIALSAIGINAADFNGVDLVSPLCDVEFTSYQGVNGCAYALIALDSGSYFTDTDVRQKLIDKIISMELDGGGWSLKGKADPDMTAMVITSLAPYYELDNVKAAVDSALDKLSELQNASGGFKSWGTENCESCATVVTALSALGIDAKTDARFVKNGVSVYDAMMSFQLANGGFAHISTGRANLMASEQAANALCAYQRFNDGRFPLYNCSDRFVCLFIERIVEFLSGLKAIFVFMAGVC